MAINPRKARSDFSNLSANRLFSLSRAKKFSIFLRNANLLLSYSIRSVLFFLPGITGTLLFDAK